MFAIKSPQTYHHQPGLLSRTGELLAVHSSDVAIITSPKAWRAVNPQLETSLEAAGIRWQVNFLTTECTDAAIETHLNSVREQNATLVLGIGGGRVLDCAKAVANLLSHVGLVTIPTVAATCAAWSPVSIIYNELGGHVRSQPLSRMPLMLLVDTKVIAQNDVRYLKAGIVDALAKWYEFRPYKQKSDDSLALNLKVQAAKLAVDVFEQYGAQAVQDNARHEVTPALMKVIDANIAVAGMANSMRDETLRRAWRTRSITVSPISRNCMTGCTARKWVSGCWCSPCWKAMTASPRCSCCRCYVNMTRHCHCRH